MQKQLAKKRCAEKTRKHKSVCKGKRECVKFLGAPVQGEESWVATAREMTGEFQQLEVARRMEKKLKAKQTEFSAGFRGYSAVPRSGGVLVVGSRV